MNDANPLEDVIGEDARYRHFQVKKRHGAWRWIEAPNDDLKFAQRELLKKLRDFSPSPFSYGTSRGARKCASAHASCTTLVRIDISSFFPSVTKDLLARESLFARISYVAGLDDDLLAKTVLLSTTQGDRLPQGAPTSPLLADLVLKSFDFNVVRAICIAAFHRGYDLSQLAYTRYVDDILISTSQKLEPDARSSLINGVQRVVKTALATLSLSIAHHKTRIVNVSPGKPAFCVGFSVAGRDLQASRVIRNRARRVCWRICHGNRVNAADRGVLSYALQGRFRLPRKLLVMLESNVLEPKMSAWLRRLIEKSGKQQSGRDLASGIVETLARSASNRARRSVGTRNDLSRDFAILCYIGAATVTPHGVRIRFAGASEEVAMEFTQLSCIETNLRILRGESLP